ncbi:glycosyltransferase [Demequina sp. SYSU T00039]|uniref:D-inositol 3-phosphate glycosyltransferase n=1 Tax=Demequina lignilytica TaxID=3051663 RepID=A0AAW7M0A2_9MICO|nr:MULTISPECIES: glycosyltransferase [unclassified Demequina]MDN4477754.1 glycosyltransferase [Demequina sp. SYSU T00039-1]MDN4487663.1 glycosyltransferase [Demequina sp. SYSU T00039]MDN4491374.1 glycosyltransferase [Demequina sp. SYSU T00068]
MGRPRVLVLTSTLPARRGDGTPPFVEDLSRELARDFDVRILAPAVPGGPALETLDAHLDVVRYRYFPSRWEDVADGAILENVRARRSRALQVPLLVGGLARALRRELRTSPPAAIHAHWVVPQGIVCHRLAPAVPTVVTTLGGDLYALRQRAIVAQKSAVLRAAAAVTVMNRDMRETAIELGAAPAATHVMPMGARFAERDIARTPAPGPASRRHPARVLAVGRLVEKKGFDVLLAALRLTSAPVELTLVGDGPDRTRLEGLAEGLPVTFRGKLTRAELDAAYGEADIAVVPSRAAASGDQDGLPVAMLEAMGAGLPVVASALPGIDEAIEAGRSGVLVPPGDAGALARSLTVLAEDPELRAALGDGARERAARYSIESVGEGYRDLLHRVIADSPR